MLMQTINIRLYGYQIPAFAGMTVKESGMTGGG